MRGLPNIRRIHAKNYIQEEADKRLDEVVKPYQQQGLNALGVDSYPVLLFLKKPSNQACTCKETQTDTDIGSTSEAVQSVGISSTNEITIDWARPLFGEAGEARIEEEDGNSLNDYEFSDTPDARINRTLESGADCGICYRYGFVPGYEQYGMNRQVFTTHNIVGQHAITIDRSSGPHEFQRLHKDGYAEFELCIPKYFKSASYSIRNNFEILDSIVYAQSGACDLAFLRQNAGKKVRVRVNAKAFTHLVVVFDLGSEVLRANIAQISKVTDWTMYNTIGNLNVILPMTIPEVPNGSFIIVPKVGLGLTVTDVQYLRVANQSNLDWSVNTRVCQPQEGSAKIHKGLTIL